MISPLLLLGSSHCKQIAQIFMQKENDLGEDRQAKNVTDEYLKSISRNYNKNNKVLGYFIHVESGYCLDCGLVHGFHNLDEAISREWRENNSSSLDRLSGRQPFN